MDTVLKLSEYARSIGSHIRLIGIPKTIDNDLCMTDHTPGFGSAAKYIASSILEISYDTFIYPVKSVTIIEIMGRDAGWLTASAALARNGVNTAPHLIYLPEVAFDIDDFIADVENQLSIRDNVIIAVSEGVRWWDDEKQELGMVYASSDLDEYGHPRFGGVSGVIASEINKRLGIEARGQISGYIPRSGKCYEYDRRLTSTLADKVVDLLLREDYGKMPVLRDIVPYDELEEFHTDAIEMGNIGNFPLPAAYYDANKFMFTDQYTDFLTNIIGAPYRMEFTQNFPIVIPE